MASRHLTLKGNLVDSETRSILTVLGMSAVEYTFIDEQFSTSELTLGMVTSIL